MKKRIGRKLFLIAANNLSIILLPGTPVRSLPTDWVAQLKILGRSDDMPDIKDMPPGKVWNWLQKENLVMNRSVRDEFSLPYEDPVIHKFELEWGQVHDLNSFYEDRDILHQVRDKLKETAMFKAGFTADFAAQLAESAEAGKVVIFTERVECANRICELLEEWRPGITLLHTGKMKSADRERARKDFSCSDGPFRILVSTRQSLSVGVNLSCADVVVFNDLPRTPADINQGAARIEWAADRTNQGKTKKEYWIQANTRFDSNLYSMLKDKRSIMKMYGEGRNITEEWQAWMMSP